MVAICIRESQQLCKCLDISRSLHFPNFRNKKLGLPNKYQQCSIMCLKYQRMHNLVSAPKTMADDWVIDCRCFPIYIVTYWTIFLKQTLVYPITINHHIIFLNKLMFSHKRWVWSVASFWWPYLKSGASNSSVKTFVEFEEGC